ncbi:uncharacterized protein LOC126456072 [Schistocerca serialis cubense]|uniref:uncharacterized protein LOC126456072 n=1 Tax=Schistocerca serialis cubense TaxID=2023355 RepID=UPI00214E531F|nr:uncharacterized protein LOC126456072 [Schistocerca serialis cubense]
MWRWRGRSSPHVRPAPAASRLPASWQPGSPAIAHFGPIAVRVAELIARFRDNTAAAGPRAVGGRDGRAAGQLGGAPQAVGAAAQEARRPPPEGPRRAHLTHRPGGQVARATMRRPFDAGLGGRQVPGARHGRRRPREPAARRGRLPEEGMVE